MPKPATKVKPYREPQGKPTAQEASALRASLKALGYAASAAAAIVHENRTRRENIDALIAVQRQAAKAGG
ncbi:MAG TPA: hypothetical protein PK435_16075 [Thermoanaerobaculaceae bacterium]|nr:hypothetical protein [Thermoanaerobaculaceae bacterium]